MRLPAFITNDWPRKAAALFFAFMIWIYASQKLAGVDTVENVPVRFTSSDRTLVMNKDKYISVKIRGAETYLKELNSNEISVELPVPDVNTPRMLELRVTPEMITLPKGVSLESFHPERLNNIQVEPLTNKTVPIRVVTGGSLGPEYQEMEEMRSIIPSTVTMTGPQSLLSGINVVYTETEYFDAQATFRKNFFKDIQLISPDPRIELSANSTQVTFTITEVYKEVEFNDIPVRIVHNPDHQLKVTAGLKPIDVVSLRLSSSQRENITANNVLAVVDISQISKPGKHLVPIKVFLDQAENNEKAADSVLYFSPRSLELTVDEIE